LRGSGARLHVGRGYSFAQAIECAATIGRIVGCRQDWLGQPHSIRLAARDRALKPVHGGLALIGRGLSGAPARGVIRAVLTRRGRRHANQREEGDVMD
jgi:hypothetical protein